MTRQVFLRTILFFLIGAITCGGCSSTQPPDNNFEKPPFKFKFKPDTQQSTIKALQNADIQYVQYGDTITLLVPNDRYFKKQSPELTGTNSCYESLYNIVKLLKYYPNAQISVAGFDDNEGRSKDQISLTQGRADTILTYLWANSIPAQSMKAQGYGDDFPLGSSNKFVHSSSYNRRIEIQWSKLGPKNCCAPSQNQAMRSATYHGMK